MFMSVDAILAAMLVLARSVTASTSDIGSIPTASKTPMQFVKDFVHVYDLRFSSADDLFRHIGPCARRRLSADTVNDVLKARPKQPASADAMLAGFARELGGAGKTLTEAALSCPSPSFSELCSADARLFASPRFLAALGGLKRQLMVRHIRNFKEQEQSREVDVVDTYLRFYGDLWVDGQETAAGIFLFVLVVACGIGLVIGVPLWIYKLRTKRMRKRLESRDKEEKNATVGI